MRERRRQGKRHLKSEFLVFQSSSRLFHLAYFVECEDELLIALSRFAKRSKFRHFLFTSSIKHEIRYFQVVILQKQQRNVQKKCDARAKLLFCLSNLLHFLTFSCRRRRRS